VPRVVANFPICLHKVGVLNRLQAEQREKPAMNAVRQYAETQARRDGEAMMVPVESAQSKL